MASPFPTGVRLTLPAKSASAGLVASISGRAYLAALDVHHARIFGRCDEETTGIAPFDRLVEQVMTRPPYNDARRVFWVVDNGAAKPPSNDSSGSSRAWSLSMVQSTLAGSTK